MINRCAVINHSVSSGLKTLDESGLPGWSDISFYLYGCNGVTGVNGSI
ncbi:hypothetical protein KCP73_16780 [Salmonella enterica subsp. enterica]|nr:hypothetical protein KCP73_16780 [Salmonella enterica subsp. enterica]